MQKKSFTLAIIAAMCTPFSGLHAQEKSSTPQASALFNPLKDRPRGIFVLTGFGHGDGGAKRYLQIIDQVSTLDYVAGVTIGFSWAETEIVRGQYDFSKVDAAISALQKSGKKLNIEVLAVEAPAYLVAQLPAPETWEAHAPGRRTIKTVVPWSQTALNAWRNYMQALASHPVSLPNGTKVPLKNHPTLIMLDSPIIGMQGVRDIKGQLTSLSGYNRKKFLDAVVQSVHATRDAFPDKFGFLGVFRMEDADHSRPLDQELMDQLMREFNNTNRPLLGFFQETLSDARPMPDALGKRLFDVKSRTYIVFQALTSWARPFTQNTEAVASGKAATGLQFAYQTYGATYAEIYITDIMDSGQTADLRKWNSILLGNSHP